MPVLRKLTEFLLRKAGKRAGIEWGEVSVVLVDDSQSHELNWLHLGHDYPTDVISFNFCPMPGQSGANTDGEIIVNVELACRIGSVFKGAHHELALYLAHGCDHLSGADDDTPHRRQQMRRRELRWLREAQQNELFDDLLLQEKNHALLVRPPHPTPFPQGERAWVNPANQ